MTVETDWLDATTIAQLVNSGRADPVEVLEAALRRIERLNPPVNAVVALDAERALERARHVDRSLPLAGVPLLVKDCHPVAGLPSMCGSRFRAGLVAERDDPLVAAYRRLGAVPVGVTNMPEAGLVATTEPVAHGACRNPWDPTRTVGGSSGGSAAAVVTGMVPLATASDGAGSIRIPASACGVFGLKPSRGRTPGTGLDPLLVNHVLTRSVRDSALVLKGTAALTPAWPGALDPGDLDFAAAASQDPPRLRVAFATRAREGVRFDAEVLAKVLETVALLEDLGHVVEEAEPDLSAEVLRELFLGLDVLVRAGTAYGLAEWETVVGRAATQEDVEPLTWKYAREGRDLSASDLLGAQQMLTRVADAVEPFYTSYDVLLLPTLAEPPPPNGVWEFPKADPLRGWLRMVMFIPPLNTSLANITGQPAMSVPLHVSSEGLPIGMQFYGRLGDDRLLLSLAGQLERALPWDGRRPPAL